MSPALGVVGQGRLNIKGKFRPKKIWAPRNPAERDMRDKLRQAGGQKGRGSGGRNFCPPAEAKPRRPARLPRSELRSTTGVQNRTQKKSFLFLLPARRSPRLAEAEPRLWRGEAVIAQNPNFQNWRYLLDKIRTFFDENPDCDF